MATPTPMKIRAFRLKHKLTQKQMAEIMAAMPLKVLAGKLGDFRKINSMQISSWENGRRCPDRMIKDAIDALEKLGHVAQ